MPNIRMPDGAVVAFPDTMTPEQIKALILKKFPAAGGLGAKPSLDPGLPMPGDTGERPPTPNEHFGFSSSDTLNPLPALNAFGTQMANNIPIAGPWLKKTGEQFDSALDNGVYRPLLGQPGTTTPEDVAATNDRQAAQNPEVAMAGGVAGRALPQVAAMSNPVTAGALGLEGAIAARFGFGIPSTYAIETGDRMAHGDDLQKAAMDSILPTAKMAPFFAFGLNPAAAMSPERAAAVATMKAEGVPLTAGQRTGSKTLQYAESELGGAKAEGVMDQQKEAFTRAALKRAGVDAPRATPEVMDEAFTTIGSHFDRLAAVTPVRLDSALQNDLLSAVAQYQNVTGMPAKAPEMLMNRIAELAGKNNGVLQGEAYQNIRSEMGAMMKNADGPTRGVLADMREALDDAVERSISPKLGEAWKVTRNRYKNLLAIETAVSRAGPDAALGLVSPANLRGALASGGRSAKRSYVRGGGDLNDLSRSGVATMTPLPNSGTASRQAVRSALMGPSAIAGGLTGHDMGGAAGAVAGALLGSGIPYAAGRALLSRPGAALMSGETPFNRLLESPGAGIIARALMSRQAEAN